MRTKLVRNIQFTHHLKILLIIELLTHDGVRSYIVCYSMYYIGMVPICSILQSIYYINHPFISQYKLISFTILL